MPVGAAIGIGSVASAGIGAVAAKSAAKTQANAARDAADVQMQMYGQTRADLSPFRAFGEAALSPYARLLGYSMPAASLGSSPGFGGTSAFTGMSGPDWAAYGAANQDLQNEWNRIVSTGNAGAFGGDPNNYYAWHYDTYGQREGRQLPMTGAPAVSTTSQPQVAAEPIDIQAMLESLPGYKFVRDQGVKSITNQLGSRGLTGAQTKGIARFVTGLADTTYGEQVNRLNQAATLGSNAAAQTGSIGASTASGVANAITGAGTAAASGTVGAANAITGGIGNVSNYLIANKLLGGGLYNSGSTRNI